MKRLLVTFSVLLTLGLSFSTVAAQSDDVATPEVEEVEGITSIYERAFYNELEAPLASPDTDVSMSDDSLIQRLVSVQAITFETDENAVAYLDMMRDGFNSDVPRDEGLGEFVVTDLDSPGVDGFKMTTDMGDFDFGTTIVIFIDGNYGFMVLVMDIDQPTSEALADDVTEFILAADIETEEISFDDDGTSTGGVFDRMPSAGDEIVGDLKHVDDTELFVNSEG